MAKISYKIDNKLTHSLNINIIFEDGQPECLTDIQVISFFELSLGIDEAYGCIPLTPELRYFLSSKNIEFVRIDIEMLIDCLNNNLTREIAFYQREDYSIFNIESITAHLVFNYLKLQGVTNFELRQAKGKGNKPLFNRLYIYPFILKELQYSCSADDLTHFYANIGAYTLTNRGFDDIFNQEVLSNVLNTLITEDFYKNKNQYLKYCEDLKYIKNKKIVLSWVEDTIIEHRKLCTLDGINNLIKFAERLQECGLSEEYKLIEDSLIGGLVKWNQKH